MINDSKRFVTIFVISNTVVISADTITQILHYSLTQWYTEEAKNLALLFILFRPVLLFCMFFTYAILHYERMLTCSKKIITLFLFLFSMYAGYSPGVHLSFYSKYYLESENGIVVCKMWPDWKEGVFVFCWERGKLVSLSSGPAGLTYLMPGPSGLVITYFCSPLRACHAGEYVFQLARMAWSSRSPCRLDRQELK